ncbi:MAG: AMP-dependent synthetase [Promethearchaeota archaeon]|nr:MAG: AMP-dependent synthetase [Candidatus Lokiarchaeota archaeon]
MSYKDKIWTKSWDSYVKDLDPKEFDMTYPQAIRRTMEEFPDKMAFDYLGITLTYKDLDEASNQFANMLIENGFKTGDVVGINLPNMPEYLMGIIGTLKAGCIVSGVSPLLSDIQMQYQLNDLGTGGNKVALLTLDAIFAGRLTKIASKLPQLKLVITTSVGGYLPKIKQVLGKLIGKIPKGKVTPLEGVTIVDFHTDLIVTYSKELPKTTTKPDDLAFIQYTGGTTGPPKGAMLTHKNIVSDIVIFQKWLNWEAGKGVALSGFPFFHIAGTFTTLNVIYLGWSQILIPNPRDSGHIIKAMAKYEPSVLANVPSLYQILMKNPKFKELDHSKLLYAVSAAAPFPEESQREFEAIVGKGKLIEAYGMTETSPLSASNPSVGVKKLGSIGLPLNNTEFKLVDPNTGKEVPIGEPGEICVKGPMVMKGYFNKPEETKNAIDKDGFMHTGDVGVMDEDGYMKIVDRTKDMIIVGGFKVFSAKLEDTLVKHPAIGMVATIGVDNPERPGSEIVKAIIQLDADYKYDGNEEALKKDITAFAKENCSPYEVPKLIEIIEELPLTAVGKVDKKSLRK